MLESIRRAVLEVSSEQIRGASWSAETLARAVIDDFSGGRASCDNMDSISGLLISANPTMGSIDSLVWALKEACYSGRTLKDGAEAFLDYMKWSREEVVRHAVDLVKGQPISVITISYSSNVVDVLASLQNMVRKVYVLESLPGGEGRNAAAELRSRRLDVELIVDAAASSYVGRADMVLIGADNVTSDGCIYNKVGSKNLAILAGYFGKPVMAVFEPYKITEDSQCGGVKLVERTYQADPWGEVSYRVFDELTRDLVDAVLSVRGLTDNTPAQISSLRRSFEEWVMSRIEGKQR
ncbi:hypothetical protein [Acidilobus sp.]|uniref:hypothetical protein n=1 Tax=Acidilobus sp. TaxID=1872109 RepID=UPI003CFC0772